MTKNVLTLLISFLLFFSCKKFHHIDLYSTYTITNNNSTEYVIYNASTILPLITIASDERIACIDNKVVYIQCNNKQHIQKYKNKIITLDDILVEPGVGYYVKLSDGWYGYISECYNDISNSNLEIMYIFRKFEFTFIGDIKELMTYNQYIEWLGKSNFLDEDPKTNIIINKK